MVIENMLYEGFIRVIALTVLGLSQLYVIKQIFFRELMLISTFVFNINLLSYGGCFSISVMKSSEILSTYSKI